MTENESNPTTVNALLLSSHTRRPLAFVTGVEVGVVEIVDVPELVREVVGLLVVDGEVV